MKKLLKILVVLVVLVGIAVVAGVVYMDQIATAAVQKAAAYATQCDVEVGKVDLKPMSGAVVITDLDIKNPEPFRDVQDSFLVLERGEAGVSYASLRTDLVEVPQASGAGITLSLVGRGGETNYDTILESLKRLQGEEEGDAPAEDEGGKAFVIREVSSDAITVIVDMDEDPALGLLPVELELTLQPITLTDIGEGGVPLSQISADLIADVLVQVIAQLGDQLGDRVLSSLTAGLSGVLGPDALQGRLTDLAGELGLENVVDVASQLERADELFERVDGLLEGGGGALEDLGNAAGDLLDGDGEGGGLLDAAGGLLGGGDDE